MTVPDFQSLMRPLLEATAAQSSEVTMKAIAPAIAAKLELSSDDLAEMLPSGRQTVFMNRLHWAKTFLDRALVINTTKRGYFEITPRGRKLLTSDSSPVSMRVLTQFPEYVAWREASKPTTNQKQDPASFLVDSVDTETPDDRISSGLAAIESELRTSLLARFQGASPAFFERSVVLLLQSMGFTNGQHNLALVTGKSGDGGIDGIIHQDALGLDAIYVQAKRYATGNGIGRPDIQKFVGSMTGESASKGVFVTTSYFSAEARSYVEKVQQRIVLIDGEKLASLALRYNIGVRTKATIELKSLDEDFFTDDILIAGGSVGD